MGKLFLGNDRRLRAGWQIAIGLFTYLFISSLLNIVMQLVVGIIFGNQDNENVYIVVNSISNLLVAASLIFVFMKLNGTSARAIGISKDKESWRQFAIGSLTGIISLCVALAPGYLLGDYRVSSVGFPPAILLNFIFFISVGIIEEVLCRGFLQQTALIRWGKLAAILFPSLLFAALHLLNPNFSFIPMLNTALCGIVMGIFTIRYDNLAAAIGFHIFWNFFLGNVFGISVSGTTTKNMILTTTVENNTIWNGGIYGIEGGLLCTLIMIITIALQLYFVKQKPINEALQNLIANCRKQGEK